MKEKKEKNKTKQKQKQKAKSKKQKEKCNMALATRSTPVDATWKKTTMIRTPTVASDKSTKW